MKEKATEFVCGNNRKKALLNESFISETKELIQHGETVIAFENMFENLNEVFLRLDDHVKAFVYRVLRKKFRKGEKRFLDEKI